MITDDLKRATVLTALNNMVRKGYLSVCTVDSCAKLLGVSCAGSEAYSVLSALHCVNFAEMPADVKRAVPELIRECFNMEPFPMFAEAKEIDASPSKPTLWMRLRLQ